jgi:glutamine amidotransferase
MESEEALLIAIIDYGVGNLQSVKNAFDKVGFAACIISNPEQLKDAERAILPGVGAFGAAMEQFKQSGFIQAVQDYLATGRLMLGICVGLQMLFTKSEEVFGDDVMPEGLDLIPGTVRRFADGKLKVPQIGWNKLKFCRESPLWRGLPEDVYTYFVHSYYGDPKRQEDVLCTSDYGVEYCAGIQKDNIFALQFHPEKSGRIGLMILKNFGELSL